VAPLSFNRLDLGIGAGWHEGEHRMFGIPFPPLKERIDRLECGARAIRALSEGRPLSLQQPYYALADAQSHPHLASGRARLIIGGKGERRVLRIVAEHADEWNVTRVTRDQYRARAAVLADHCRAVRRDPGAIRRSLMVPVIVGRSPGDMARRRARAREVFPRMPEDAAGWQAAGFLHGVPAEIVAALQAWASEGIGRVMLQMLDLEDLDAIELIASEVLPALRRQ
jgi:alkanesulfonate monooxygenase SsuD/methylene tetrahydromethanopterin reductase-like flavin-dependent oxidoreductase (luciferase family)